VGKRTIEIDQTITAVVATNDGLRALTGRARIDGAAKLAASEAQLTELNQRRAAAEQADADEATAAHAQRVATAAADVKTSRAAEKLAADIDADASALVAKVGQLTAMTAARCEPAKQALLEAHGIPALIDRIEAAQRWVATAVGNDRELAGAEMAEVNREYSIKLSDMSGLLEPLAPIRPTSPAAAEAIANIFMRIRAAWSGEAPPKASLTLADAHATATAALERHLAKIKQTAPKS
jgi:hypothetical protein